MKPHRRQGRDALVGFAIVAALVAVAAAIVLLDRFVERVEPTYRLVVTFPEVPRLQPGDPVLLAGRPTGRIVTIDFMEPVREEDMRLAVAVDLGTRHRELVRTDSEARTVRPRLLGRPVINILPGSPGARILDDGDTLRVREALRPEWFASQATALLHKADTVHAGVRRIEALARARLAELERMDAETDALRAELDRLAEAVRVGPVADPTWREGIRALRATVDEIGRVFSLRVDQLGGAPDRVAIRLQEVRERIAEIEAVLDPPMGTVPRLMEDPAIEDAVTRIRAQLDTLMVELRANPLRLFF